MELKIPQIPLISAPEDPKTNWGSISAEVRTVLMNVTKVAIIETLVTGGLLPKPWI